MRFRLTAALLAASVSLTAMARAETTPSKALSHSKRQDDDALAARLAWIPTNTGRLSIADLQGFVDVATALQARSPEQVGDFLEKISLDRPVYGPTRFILLRFLFELPDAYVRPIGQCPYSWGGMPQSAGWVNLSWPINWRYGQPTYLGGPDGYDGPPYNARFDFEAFREHYQYRRLPAIVMSHVGSSRGARARHPESGVAPGPPLGLAVDVSPPAPLVTRLLKAIAEDNQPSVKSLLELPRMANAFDQRSGDTPLALAVRLGRDDLIPLIVAAGAQLEEPFPSRDENGPYGNSYGGYTPLMLAAYLHGRTSTLRLLLRLGADPNGRGTKLRWFRGYSSGSLSAQSRANGFTPLMAAALSGNGEGGYRKKCVISDQAATFS